MKLRFDEHIGLIYAAIGNHGGWSDFLTELVADLDIRSGIIGLDDLVSKRVLVSSAAGISTRDIELMTGEFIGKDIWTNRLHELDKGRFYTSDQMVEDRDLLKSDFYNVLCREVDLKYSTGCLIDSNNQYSLRIALQATHDQRSFAGSVDYLNKLLPHIKQASRLHQLLTTDLVTKNSLEVLLESLTVSAAVMTPQLAIKYANTSFNKEILEGSSKSWLTTDEQQEIEVAVAALYGKAGLVSPIDKPIRCRFRDQTIELELINTGPSSDYFDMVEPLILTRVLRAPKRGNLNQDVADCYELTKREQELAEMLCDGETLLNIAEFRKRSFYTVKSQLAAIFQKTKTKSQAQLVAKLMGDSK